MDSHDGFDALEPIRKPVWFGFFCVLAYIVGEGTADDEQNRDWDYEVDATHDHDDSVLREAVIGVTSGLESARFQFAAASRIRRRKAAGLVK